MTDIELFTYDDHDVRVVTINDEPWWVVKDICDVLEIADASQAASRLDEADRCQALVSSGGQRRHMNVVNEAGLYDLLLRSEKPEARPFQRWLTHDVVPQIRRTGSYSTRPALPVETDLAGAIGAAVGDAMALVLARTDAALATERALVDRRFGSVTAWGSGARRRSSCGATPAKRSAPVSGIGPATVVAVGESAQRGARPLVLGGNPQQATPDAEALTLAGL